MASEIGRCLRCSACRQIGGRGAEHTSGRGDLARHDRLILGLVDPKRDIEPILSDLEAGVGQRQMRLQRGMSCGEFREQRCDPPATELHRRPDPSEDHVPSRRGP